jgi:two-component system, sensor histidine kinase and response regulator
MRKIMALSSVQPEAVMLQPELPRLLAVDDDLTNLELLERIFCADFQVTRAVNGEEALHFLSGHHFDIVLMDITMPVMDGLETLRAIRETPETAELPVILVSAVVDSDAITEGLNLGANDYISKPINLDVARARVHSQLKLKQLIDERKETIQQMQALYEMKDRLFRMASHDLKGPITNIRMAQYFLRDILSDNPGVASILDTIEAAVNTMQEMVADFLDTSALQSNMLDLNLGAVNVSDLIWDTTTQYNLSAYRKDITIQVIQTEGMIHADSFRMSQVLGNLVSNAVKYSPHGTIVTIWSEIHQDFVRICVADQGPGIREEERGYLFQQFSKLSNKPTGGESSTGLGLWIVKQLVTQHNGTIGFHCPPEGGSIFWVDIPAYVEYPQDKPIELAS